MSDPAKDDRDDALLRRLYDEPDADAGGARSVDHDVESYRRMRGAFADYARATEVEPPSRGMDELLAAARSRSPARAAAVAPEDPGFWSRLRAWFQPISSHPALASAAMVIVVAVIGGVLYVKGKANVADQEVGPTQDLAVQREVAAGSANAPVEPPVVARLEDGSEEGRQFNHTSAPGSGGSVAGEAGGKDKNAGKPTRPGATAPAGSTIDETLAVEGRPLKDGEGRTGTATGTATRDTGKVAVGDGVIITEGQERDRGGTSANLSTVPSTTTGTTLAQPVTPDSAGLNTTDDDARPPEPPPEKAVSKDGKKRGPDITQLTRQARTAARAGDCGVVKVLASKVRAANATYYKQTFEPDADIKKCK